MESIEQQVLRTLVDHREINDGWMLSNEIRDAIGESRLHTARILEALASLRGAGLVETRTQSDPPPGLPARLQYRVKPGRMSEARQILAEEHAARRAERLPLLAPSPSPA